MVVDCSLQVPPEIIAISDGTVTMTLEFAGKGLAIEIENE